MTYFSMGFTLLVLALVFSAFRILREYDRGVVFLLGRFYKVKGPGAVISGQLREINGCRLLNGV